MQRPDIRTSLMLLAAVGGIAVALGAAIFLRHHPEYWSQARDWLGAPGQKNWATIVQLVGAVITAAGLAVGFGAGLMDDMLGKTVLRWGRNAGKRMSPHYLRALREQQPSQSGDMAFVPRAAMPVEQQVENLAKQLGRIEEMLLKLNQAAENDIDEAERRALEQIDILNNRLKMTRDVGLPWAAFGLLITLAGTWLGYGT